MHTFKSCPTWRITSYDLSMASHPPDSRPQVPASKSCIRPAGRTPPTLASSLPPQNTLSPVLSKAPCVTRLIKTNTGHILVSNPIVLFFFKLALERRVLVFGTLYMPPLLGWASISNTLGHHIWRAKCK